MMVRPAKGHPSQQFRHVSNRFDEMDPFSVEEMIEERRIQRQQANTTHTRKFGLMNLLHQKNNGIPRVIKFQGEEEQEEIEDIPDIAAPHIGMVIEVQLDEEDEKDRILRRRRSISLDKNQRPNSMTSRSQRPHASLSPKRTSIKRQNSLDDTEHGSARSSRRELTRAQGTASLFSDDVPLPSHTVTLQDAEHPGSSRQGTLSQEATPHDHSAIDETLEQMAERKPHELRLSRSSNSMSKQNVMRRACSSNGINKPLLTRSGTSERQTTMDETLRNRNARTKDCMNDESLSEQRRARWREMINEYGIVKPELQSKQPTKDVDAGRRDQRRARSRDPTDGEKYPLDRVTVSEREWRRANSRDPVGEDDRPAFYKMVLAERKSKQQLDDIGAKNSLSKMRRARSMDDIEDDGPPLECVVFNRQPRRIAEKQRSDRHSYRGLPKARPRDAVDDDTPLDGRMTVSERQSRRPLTDIIDTHSHREPRRAFSSANIYERASANIHEAKLSDRRSTQLLAETMDGPSRNERRLLIRSSDVVDDDRRSSLDREGERRRASSIGNIYDNKPNRESERTGGRRPLDREGERCRANSVNYINEDKPSRGSERSIASGTLGPPRASELYVSQRSATSTKSSSSLRSLQTLEPSPSSLRSVSSKSFSNLLLLHSSSETSGRGRSSVSPYYHRTARPVYSSGPTPYPESASLQRHEHAQDHHFTQELLKKCSTSMGDIANKQRRKPKAAYVHSLFEAKKFRITGERPPKPRESTTAV